MFDSSLRIETECRRAFDPLERSTVFMFLAYSVNGVCVFEEIAKQKRAIRDWSGSRNKIKNTAT